MTYIEAKTLQKEAQFRIKDDMELLIKETSNITFFSQYNQEGDNTIHKDCCKYMNYEFIPNQDYVFHIDTVGTKFYIILQGTIGIQVRINQNLVQVQTLTSGASFGELALLNNKPRMASIVCLSDCHFAVLDLKSFNLVLQKAEETKLLREMGIFAKLPIFKSWSFNLIKQIYLNTFTLHISRDFYVYRQNQQINSVYIIQEGTFAVTKKYQLKVEQHQEGIIAQKIAVFKDKRDQINKYQEISLYAMGPGEIFGEEDLILQHNKRTFSVKSVDNEGCLYMIMLRDFNYRIMNQQDSAQYLSERLKSKSAILLQFQLARSEYANRIAEVYGKEPHIFAKSPLEQNYYEQKLFEYQQVKDNMVARVLQRQNQKEEAQEHNQQVQLNDQKSHSLQQNQEQAMLRTFTDQKTRLFQERLKFNFYQKFGSARRIQDLKRHSNVGPIKEIINLDQITPEVMNDIRQKIQFLQDKKKGKVSVLDKVDINSQNIARFIDDIPTLFKLRQMYSELVGGDGMPSNNGFQRSIAALIKLEKGHPETIEKFHNFKKKEQKNVVSKIDEDQQSVKFQEKEKEDKVVLDQVENQLIKMAVNHQFQDYQSRLKARSLFLGGQNKKDKSIIDDLCDLNEDSIIEQDNENENNSEKSRPRQNSVVSRNSLKIRQVHQQQREEEELKVQNNKNEDPQQKEFEKKRKSIEFATSFFKKTNLKLQGKLFMLNNNNDAASTSEEKKNISFLSGLVSERGSVGAGANTWQEGKSLSTSKYFPVLSTARAHESTNPLNSDQLIMNQSLGSASTNLISPKGVYIKSISPSNSVSDFNLFSNEARVKNQMIQSNSEHTKEKLEQVGRSTQESQPYIAKNFDILVNDKNQISSPQYFRSKVPSFHFLEDIGSPDISQQHTMFSPISKNNRNDLTDNNSAYPISGERINLIKKQTFKRILFN